MITASCLALDVTKTKNTLLLDMKYENDIGNIGEVISFK
jgi:hypothetical protein